MPYIQDERNYWVPVPSKPHIRRYKTSSFVIHGVRYPESEWMWYCVNYDPKGSYEGDNYRQVRFWGIGNSPVEAFQAWRRRKKSYGMRRAKNARELQEELKKYSPSPRGETKNIGILKFLFGKI